MVDLFFYYTPQGKKEFFTLDSKHSDDWKRFFLECGGSVQKKYYEYFLTTIDEA